MSATLTRLCFHPRASSNTSVRTPFQLQVHNALSLQNAEQVGTSEHLSARHRPRNFSHSALTPRRPIPSYHLHIPSLDTQARQHHYVVPEQNRDQDCAPEGWAGQYIPAKRQPFRRWQCNGRRTRRWHQQPVRQHAMAAQSPRLMASPSTTTNTSARATHHRRASTIESKAQVPCCRRQTSRRLVPAILRLSL